MLDEAFDHIRSGERYMEAELLRYRGDFHIELGEMDKAENAYRELLAVAVRQQAKVTRSRSRSRFLTAVSDRCRVRQTRPVDRM